VDVASSIQAVLMLDEHQVIRGVALDVRLAPYLSLHADADAPSQLWINLFQTVKGSGRLWGTAGLLPGRGVRVVVGNDGPPIPPDILARIFEALLTKKDAVSGLGSRVSGLGSRA